MIQVVRIELDELNEIIHLPTKNTAQLFAGQFS